MFALARFLLLVVVCLVAIGLYRGWFSMSKPVQDPQGEKVNISVSIDAGKVKADTAKVREKIAETVGPPVKKLEEKLNTQEAK